MQQSRPVQAQCAKNAVGNPILQETRRRVQGKTLQEQLSHRVGKAKMAHFKRPPFQGKAPIPSRQSVEKNVRQRKAPHECIEKGRLQKGQTVRPATERHCKKDKTISCFPKSHLETQEKIEVSAICDKPKAPLLEP